MLVKINRLRKSSDFKKVLQGGEFVSGVFFNARAAKNNLDFSRFGFVTGTRVSKKAALRNRARRQTQESVRSLLKKIMPGWDIVFVLKSRIIGQEQAQIKQDIENVVKKAKLFA